jgi:hypothetical protein
MRAIRVDINGPMQKILSQITSVLLLCTVAIWAQEEAPLKKTEPFETEKPSTPPRNAESSSDGKEIMGPQSEVEADAKSEFSWFGPSVVPWIFATLLAASTGALAMWVFFMRKQGAKFEELRKRILDGGQQIPLLTEEALMLLTQLRGDLKEGTKKFETDQKAYQVKTEEILNNAQQAAQDTQLMTKQLVDDFKDRVQKHLDKVVTYMQRIADSSAGANETANKTMEYSKQVTESLRSRDNELAELKKGYQMSMLAPLVQSVLTIRDELIQLESVMKLDESTREQLNDFNISILESLNVLGIHQLEIAEGHDLNDIPIHKWDTLEVSRPTKEPHLDRKVAEVIKHGYVIHGPHAHDSVVRKARVIRYKYNDEQQSGPLDESNEETNEANK